MADVKHFELFGVSYDIHDETARTAAGYAQTTADVAKAASIENRAALDGLTTRVGATEHDIEDIFTQLATGDGAYINVMSHGAVADGATDCTAAFAAAMQQAQRTGAPVYIPAGQYRLNGGVTVPDGVTVFGVPVSSGVDRKIGTWILPTSTSAPAFSIGSGCSLRGLAFYYPLQRWTGAPVVYPAAIYLRDHAAQTYIDRLYFLNTYTAVDANRHHASLYISNINGYAIVYGILIGDSSDVDSLEHIHFNHTAALLAGLPDIDEHFKVWTRTHGTAFSFGQCDWIRVNDCFCYGYSLGFFAQLTDLRDHAQPGGLDPAGLSGATFTSCGADACGRCVLITKGTLEGAKHYGVQFTDCYFTAYYPAAYPSADVQKWPAVNVDHCEDVTFTGCRWWGCSDTAAYIIATVPKFEGCTFWDYAYDPRDAANSAAIVFAAGNATITGCTINGKATTNGIICTSSAGALVGTSNTVMGISGPSYRVLRSDVRLNFLRWVDNAEVGCKGSGNVALQQQPYTGIYDDGTTRTYINLVH